MVSNTRLPLKNGLWLEEGGTSSLLASRCKRCRELFFPVKENGFCSHCQSKSMEEIRLSSAGIIKTYTIVYQQPGGGFYKGPVPYAYGIVELPEGVNVETLFAGGDFNQIRTGQKADLVIETLYRDDEGAEILTYKFKPVIE